MATLAFNESMILSVAVTHLFPDSVKELQPPFNHQPHEMVKLTQTIC